MSKELSKSAERNTFQKEKYLERQADAGKTPENDPETQSMVDYFDSFITQEDNREKDPEWYKNNLEADLRTTEWILDKARSSKSYAQNIYAALCNNGFTKLDVMPILTEQEWSCSWRYAGGIVAHMRQEGDYIDWYCSGIRDTAEPSEEEWNSWTQEQQCDWINVYSKYVGEGRITQEVRDDLKRLGWVPAAGGDWENYE